MQDLEAYLQSTLVLSVKPTTDILNLIKIQEHMWKQKNYTEAKKVNTDIKKLQQKQFIKFNEMRNEKIRVQMNHLRVKHEQENRVLNKKLTNLMDEVNR